MHFTFTSFVADVLDDGVVIWVIFYILWVGIRVKPIMCIQTHAKSLGFLKENNHNYVCKKCVKLWQNAVKKAKNIINGQKVQYKTYDKNI